MNATQLVPISPAASSTLAAGHRQVGAAVDLGHWSRLARRGKADQKLAFNFRRTEASSGPSAVQLSTDAVSGHRFFSPVATAALQGPTPFRAPPILRFNRDARHVMHRRRRWSEIEARIRFFGRLKPDWDGEGGWAPNARVVANAIDFARRLAPFASVPVPELGVAGDGEIEFRWRRGERFASISFLDDGHIVAFVSEPAGRPWKLDREYRWGALPLEFSSRLKQFA